MLYIVKIKVESLIDEGILLRRLQSALADVATIHAVESSLFGEIIGFYTREYVIRVVYEPKGVVSQADVEAAIVQNIQGMGLTTEFLGSTESDRTLEQLSVATTVFKDLRGLLIIVAVIAVAYAAAPAIKATFKAVK